MEEVVGNRPVDQQESFSEAGCWTLRRNDGHFDCPWEVRAIFERLRNVYGVE